MLLTIDVHSGVPVYRQLVDQIRRLIVSGQLKPGDEIPSTRTLSSDLGLNPMTVSRAYALLEDEGALERRPGLPSIVRATAGPTPASRHAEFVRSLGPVAALARQLGLTGREASDALRRLIDDQEKQTR